MNSVEGGSYYFVSLVECVWGGWGCHCFVSLVVGVRTPFIGFGSITIGSWKMLTCFQVIVLYIFIEQVSNLWRVNKRKLLLMCACWLCTVGVIPNTFGTSSTVTIDSLYEVWHKSTVFCVKINVIITRKRHHMPECPWLYNKETIKSTLSSQRSLISTVVSLNFVNHTLRGTV